MMNTKNRNLNVECVSSSPFPVPVWNQPFHLNFLNNSKLIGNVLIIKNISEYNKEKYVCSAFNKYGTSLMIYKLVFNTFNNEFQFYLSRFLSKTNINNETYENRILDHNLENGAKTGKKPSDFSIAKLNDRFILQCPIKYDEKNKENNYSVLWYKSDIFDFLPKSSIKTRSGNLYISKIGVNDFGAYTCEHNSLKHEIYLNKLDYIPLLNEKNSFISFNISNILYSNSSIFRIELSFKNFQDNGILF